MNLGVMNCVHAVSMLPTRLPSPVVVNRRWSVVSAHPYVWRVEAAEEKGNDVCAWLVAVTGFCDNDANLPVSEILVRRNMNAAMEFHDSEVKNITLADGVLTISLSPAYIHQSEGRPGVDFGEGFLQAIDLVFSEATLEGSLNLSGELSTGVVTVDEHNMTLVPIPFLAKGSISAQLVLNNGSVIRVSAKSISCKPIGTVKWIESFPGA